MEVVVVKENVRNANGMGCVYKLSGNRRRPWVACVTASLERLSDSTYKQKRKIIGYFESEQQATFQLWNYNKNPILYDKLLEAGSLTFANLYEEWSKAKYPHLTQTSINGYKAAYAKCDAIKNYKMIDLKTMHFQNVMNKSVLSLASDRKLKSLMVLISEYAMQNDVIQKNYAKYVMINRKEEIENIHQPFSENELSILFKNDEIPYVDTIIIMIYTGFRVGELLAIKRDDFDFRFMTLRGGAKTASGKNRIVPIHYKIQDYIMKYYNYGGDYLFCDRVTHKKMNYHTYRNTYFDPIMKKFKMQHLPHDCRHTFATRLSNSGANSTCIKKMIGHSSYETTEKIYTHKDISQLRKAINFME